MLTEAMRQKDGEFFRSLGLARKGDISCLDYLNQAYGGSPREGSVFLYPSNQKARARNEECLSALPGKAFSFETEFIPEGEAASRWAQRDLFAGVPQVVSFKEGAQIIFTATDYGGSCSRLIRHPGEGGQLAGKPNFINGMSTHEDFLVYYTLSETGMIHASLPLGENRRAEGVGW